MPQTPQESSSHCHTGLDTAHQEGDPVGPDPSQPQMLPLSHPPTLPDPQVSLRPDWHLHCPDARAASTQATRILVTTQELRKKLPSDKKHGTSSALWSHLHPEQLGHQLRPILRTQQAPDCPPWGGPREQGLLATAHWLGTPEDRTCSYSKLMLAPLPGVTVA